MSEDDVLVVGGGVVGLALAYELAGRGRRVRLIERGVPGQEASWAGAGIIPPAHPGREAVPLDDLARLGSRLHPEWSERLRAETGIDNGYRRCGGLYLVPKAVPAGVGGTGEDSARQATTIAAGLAAWTRLLQTHGRTVLPIDAAEAAALEPELSVAGILGGLHLPDEAQVRNPRHLKALLAACPSRSVNIQSETPLLSWEVQNGRVVGAVTPHGTLRAGQYVIAGGAWSGGILEGLGLSFPIKPMRGQIALLVGASPRLSRVVNVGTRYLVPRDDGRLLVGSTEEDVGFVKESTSSGVRGLLDFAEGLLPCAKGMQVEQCWAGLRPATPDGLPLLGRLPGFDNAFLAAGHFRAGLHLSCATARVMTQLLLGETPEVELQPFAPERFAAARSA